MSARPVGEVFQLKVPPDELRSELIPSFDQVLDSWEKGVLQTRYADPAYVLEVTYFTEPLKVFVERVARYLASAGVFGEALEHGFGFGKTHSLIVLWHLFTSELHAKVQPRLAIDDRLARETLAVGLDFSQRKPLARVVSLLKSYASPNHPVARVKDSKLVHAVAQTLDRRGSSLAQIGPNDLAVLLREVVERYRDLGGTPRLLVLIDELGFGIAERVRRFGEAASGGDARAAEEAFAEANSIVNFLSYLYSELSKTYCSAVVVWVFAEQDRRQIEALLRKYHDVSGFAAKVEGLVSDLEVISQRYSRGAGGVRVLELSYSPEHALEITLHRVFRTVGDREVAANALLSQLANAARQLNIGEVYEKYRDELRKFYPLSLGMVNLLKKVMNRFDAPRTEYVRTTIQVASMAAEEALRRDASSAYAVGLKHLSLSLASQAELMGEFVGEWIQAVSDLEMAVSELEGFSRECASAAAKYILAKGVTANVSALLGLGERRDVERYGSSLDEVQLEILQTFPAEKGFALLDKLSDAMEELKMRSSRIDERELDGKRFYLPSLYRTVYSALAAYVHEEKKKLQGVSDIPVYIGQSVVQNLFRNVRVSVDGRDVSVALMGLGSVRDPSSLAADRAFRDSQREGRLLLVLVPPWDATLFNELAVKGRSYDDLVGELAERLQKALSEGLVEKPLHLVVMVPDVSKPRLSGILDRLATLQGTVGFIDYISRMRDEIYNRIVSEYESVLVKRQEVLSEELRRRHEASLKSKALRDIDDAMHFAQRQLLRVSREVVAGILSLYSKAVYFSLDDNKFVSFQVSSDRGKDVEKVEGGDLLELTSRYASIVNGYLADVVGRLGYKTKPFEISRAVLQALERDAKIGQLPDSVREEDFLSNLLLGTYGVKPIDRDVAREALRMLNGQRIDLEDKFVDITLDVSAAAVRFTVKPKVEEMVVEQVEEAVGVQPVRPAEAPPALEVAGVEDVALELPSNFNVEELSQRIVALLNELGGPLKLARFNLDAGAFSLAFELRDVDASRLRENETKAVLNLLSRLSASARKGVAVEMKLGKRVSGSKVKEIFGDYFRVVRGIERFLP
jgi:hypothetical protein